MSKRLKILTVCGCGLGSSLMVKTNIESVTKDLGLDVSVEAGDVGTAKGRGADLLIVTKTWAHSLKDFKDAPVVILNNVFDKNELRESLTMQLKGMGVIQ